MGVPYFRNKRWQIYNLSLSPAVWFTSREDEAIKIAAQHDLVCEYMDFIIQKHGITSDEYRKCWHSDFDSIEWLNYFDVLEEALKWDNAGGRKSGSIEFKP
jgi:hypothetical protein